MSAMNVSRRRFLQTSAVTGGGLVVGFTMTGCSSNTVPLPVASAEGAWTPNAFLQILPDNTIRFYTARAEMGQGVTTGLATLVGEELDVNPLDMDIRQAGAHEDYVNPEFGIQGTGASSSIRVHYIHRGRWSQYPRADSECGGWGSGRAWSHSQLKTVCDQWRIVISLFGFHHHGADVEY